MEKQPITISSKPAHVTIGGLTVALGGRTVLDGVDLEIRQGMCLALLGPSGCGKSTLLRAIAGLVSVRAGEVRVDGEALSAVGVGALCRRMGYVIQEGGLFPHLTAAQNVTLGARFRGMSPAEIEERLAEVVGASRFPPALLDRYPTELSGGQRQRVGLARALFGKPGLLLLDEPFGALDPIVRVELQDELRALLRARATTALLVTHDVAEAGLLGDRIALLHDGRVAQLGTLRELVEAPATPFVEAFMAAHRGVRELLAAPAAEAGA